MPDLVIWNAAKLDCKFVEVKGPGDSAQENQKARNITHHQCLGTDIKFYSFGLTPSLAPVPLLKSAKLSTRRTLVKRNHRRAPRK